MESNEKSSHPRRPRVDADWRLAAELFGQGFGIAEVAVALRCPVAKAQRNLRESRRFRCWIAEAEARATLAAKVERHLRAPAARQAVETWSGLSPGDRAPAARVEDGRIQDRQDWPEMARNG